MTIDTSSGLISWPSPVAGLHNVEVVAQNTSGSDVQSFQVNIAMTVVAPEITSTPVTTVQLGDNYVYQVTAVGQPAPTFSLDTAPTGMNIDPLSGLITWTPTAPGQYEVVVRASNSSPHIATQSFLLEVEGPPAPTYQLVYSRHSNRSSPAPLDGATVSGDIFIFLDPGNADIASVTFYLDGRRMRTDTNAPFDLVNGTIRKAAALRTIKWPDGSHVVMAQVVLRDGSTNTLTATFNIQNQVQLGQYDILPVLPSPSVVIEAPLTSRR
jgi:hypothetical protein